MCQQRTKSKPVQDDEKGLALESPGLGVDGVDDQARLDHDHQVPVAVLADWDDDHVFREELHILGPTPHPHVSPLCCAQGLVLLETVWLQAFAGWLREHALVEHRGEDVHVGSILLVQLVLMEVGKVKVDDDVVEEGVVLQGLVVLESD